MSRLRELIDVAGQSPIERATALYRKIVATEVVKSGRWVSESNALVFVETQDLENNSKIRKALRFDTSRGEFSIDGPGIIVGAKAQQYFSPSGRLSMYATKTGEKYRIDVNSSAGSECTVYNVPSEPISDPNLQFVAWLEGERGLVYVGEKQAQQSCKPWELKQTITEQELTVAAQKSTWETKDSWGESFTNNSCFTLFLLDIERGTVIDLIDDTFSLKYSSVSPACLQTKSGTNIVFTGVSHDPRRLGIVYCRNRPSKTFIISTSTAKQLPEEVRSVSQFRGMFNVRVEGDKVAFFSQAREGSRVVKGNFPHNCAASLHVTSVTELLSAETDGTTFYDKTLIVPIVAETPANPDEGFHGLYPPTGNDLWWILNGSRLLVSSVSRSSVKIFSVDIQTKDVKPLKCCEQTQAGQWSIMDVSRSNVLLAHYTDLLSGSLVYSVDLLGGTTSKCSVGSTFPFSELNDEYSVEVIRNPDAHDSEAIYTFKRGCEGSRPTLVIVHGGPHSTDTNAWVPAQMLYLLGGFNLFSINYGGSLGFGHHRIQELMGNAGTNDVADCISCIQKMDSRWDRNKLAVYGGSHGGFLSGHLTGRYPDLFKVAIIRNPVINIASSHFETDIPDWNLAICDVEENSLDVAKMYAMSPIVHANSVKAATLLGIGLDDCRVRPFQGRSWYHALKAAPARPLVRMLEYPENNHALDGVHAYADFAIRGLVFAGEAVGCTESAK